MDPVFPMFAAKNKIFFCDTWSRADNDSPAFICIKYGNSKV